MDGYEEMNSDRCLRYLGLEDGMKRGGKVQGVNDILICLCGWWLALFPCQVRVKRKLCVAVGVSCRYYKNRTAACEEYWARIDRDQPMREGGEDPYQRCRRIIHITCRCVIFSCSSSVPAWDGSYGAGVLDGFFLRFRVSTALQEQSGQ